MSLQIPFQPLQLSNEETEQRGEEFFRLMDLRRNVRDFSDRPVPKELIELAIRTASTSPSGAHRQPWKFVAISQTEIKKQIRVAVETEEKQSYDRRMSAEWLHALAPIGTNWEKPYLEIVPWIVVVFEETYRIAPQGNVEKNYYVKESVGIACGIFITALHQMGLATLTHTPSPMAFLANMLGRPANERPFILFPVGYPAKDCTVPNLRRKTLDEVAIWME
ncbi:MAG: nitroreductase family protein [Zavarzinella sp.]